MADLPPDVVLPAAAPPITLPIPPNRFAVVVAPPIPPPPSFPPPEAPEALVTLPTTLDVDPPTAPSLPEPEDDPAVPPAPSLLSRRVSILETSGDSFAFVPVAPPTEAVAEQWPAPEDDVEHVPVPDFPKTWTTGPAAPGAHPAPSVVTQGLPAANSPAAVFLRQVIVDPGAHLSLRSVLRESLHEMAKKLKTKLVTQGAKSGPVMLDLRLCCSSSLVKGLFLPYFDSLMQPIAGSTERPYDKAKSTSSSPTAAPRKRGRPSGAPPQQSVTFQVTSQEDLKAVFPVSECETDALLHAVYADPKQDPRNMSKQELLAELVGSSKLDSKLEMQSLCMEQHCFKYHGVPGETHPGITTITRFIATPETPFKVMLHFNGIVHLHTQLQVIAKGAAVTRTQ